MLKNKYFGKHERVVDVPKQKIFINASNVTGLGASQVVSSLLRAFAAGNRSAELVIALPDHGALSTFDIVGGYKFVCVKRVLPNSISRIIECIFPKLYFANVAQTIVLGDLPLRGFRQQIVLVHQANLIKPRINPCSSNSLSSAIMRKIFAWNLRYVKYVVVQSAVMKDQLIDSFPVLKGAVKVVPQPAPDWFGNVKWRNASPNSKLTLFYPAAGYPHKNHQLIEQLVKNNKLCDNVKEFIVTLDSDERCHAGTKIHNVGRLSPEKCMEYYANADALFFPSIAESYGLPLLEAMLAGMPVICADLPYARWMCEKEAIYFDPQDVYSANRAINYAKERLASGWQPNWDSALKKIPSNWGEVSVQFMELLLD